MLACPPPLSCRFGGYRDAGVGTTDDSVTVSGTYAKAAQASGPPLQSLMQPLMMQQQNNPLYESLDAGTTGSAVAPAGSRGQQLLRNGASKLQLPGGSAAGGDGGAAAGQLDAMSWWCPSPSAQDGSFTRPALPDDSLPGSPVSGIAFLD